MNGSPPSLSSSFLKARVAKAKAAAAAAAAAAAPTPATASRSSTASATQPLNQQPTALTSRPTKPTPKPKKTNPANVAPTPEISPRAAKGGGSDLENRFAGRSTLPTIDDDLVRRIVRETASGSAKIVDLLDQDLPRLVATIIKGAMIVGPGGHPDRMTLFRMLGLPWTPHGGKPVAQAGQLDEAASNRLANALSRIERRLAGHEPVTLDAVEVTDTRPAGLIEG